MWLKIIFSLCIFSIFLDLGTTYIALTFYPDIFIEGNNYIACIYAGCGATNFVLLFLFFRVLVAILVKNLAAIEELKIAFLVLWTVPGLFGGILNSVKLLSL
jgi:hypothetical protein